MALPFFGGSRWTVGLDIGSSAVKLIELKPLKRGYQLVNLGMAKLPPEAIVEGALMNSAAVVEAIKGILGSLKVKSKDAAIALAGSAVTIRRVKLPAMTQEELEESIKWEAEQYITLDVNEVNLDFQILGGPDEQNQMPVLLVAGKKDQISEYSAVLVEAGLNPVVVDVAAFAVGNAFEVNYGISEGEIVCLVNVGSSITSLNVTKGGLPVFTRDLNRGGNAFTEGIQKQLGVSFEEAEKVKTSIREAPPPEVAEVLQSAGESLGNEIHQSIEYWAQTAPDEKVSRLFLSGGGAKTFGLDKVIGEKTGLPTEILNPFKSIEYSPKAFDESYLNDIAPSAAVAVGLALRQAADR